MKTETIYSRKISATEAKKNYIFILKNKLSVFPPEGNEFKLVKDELTKNVKIESYSCICRGPDRPHEHYFIRWNGLKAGDKVEIIKVEDNDEYLLKIK